MKQEDIVAMLALDACFYQSQDGLMLRMSYVDEESGQFTCTDENTGEDYDIRFDEVSKGDAFYNLKKVIV